MISFKRCDNLESVVVFQTVGAGESKKVTLEWFTKEFCNRFSASYERFLPVSVIQKKRTYTVALYVYVYIKLTSSETCFFKTLSVILVYKVNKVNCYSRSRFIDKFCIWYHMWWNWTIYFVHKCMLFSILFIYEIVC